MYLEISGRNKIVQSNFIRNAIANITGQNMSWLIKRWLTLTQIRVKYMMKWKNNVKKWRVIGMGCRSSAVEIGIKYSDVNSIKEEWNAPTLKTIVQWKERHPSRNSNLLKSKN